MQIRAIVEIIKVEVIHAWDSNQDALTKYKNEIESEFSIPVIIANSEKGETWHPLNKNIITKVDIYGEIGEILLDKKPGRENDEEKTIFDSTGMAIQDNTTSYKIYQNAKENNVGTFFEFFE